MLNLLRHKGGNMVFAATARVSTPRGMKPIHDDRLISAALIAEADRLIQLGKLNLGQAKSAIIRPSDPLQNLSF